MNQSWLYQSRVDDPVHKIKLQRMLGVRRLKAFLCVLRELGGSNFYQA
jgi:hypothetical protein